MLEQRAEQHFIDGADLKYQLAQVVSKPLAEAVQALLACVTSGAKVLACGNGAAGLLARHFATLFVNGFERERPELAALALQAEAGTSATGARTSDADACFARSVRALGQPGDVLLVISADGQSANELAALHAAHEREMTVLALTGGQGGRLAAALRETDVHLGVPHERAARVHEIHLLVLHCLCDGVDNQLLGEQEG